MKDFPAFMKNPKNHIKEHEQNTPDVEGYVFQGADGGQMAFWTCLQDRKSKKHTHPFDEYFVCVSGKYIAYIEGKEYVLQQGDELFIPKGAEQWGECIAGTRTIHAFGGQRVKG